MRHTDRWSCGAKRCDSKPWRRGREAVRAGWPLLVPLLLLPMGARAQLTTSVSATGQYQYDSNVFDLQRGYLGVYDLSDRYYAYGAGVNLNEQISQQNLFFRGSDTEYDYDRFSDLTHNEYNLDAGWLWKIGQDVNGNLEVTRTHTMVPFTEVIDIVLSVETDQRESGSAGFLITPEWRIDFNAYRDEVQEPLPAEDEPTLEFNDSGGGALLRYLGGGEWVGNANVTFQRGGFSGANPVAATGAFGFFGPAYTQWTESLGTTYSPAGQGAGVSTLDFAIGRTTRSSRVGEDDLSGTTGHLDYTRQLTGKTSVSLALDRDISTYVTFAGGDIASSATLTANWNVTFKTSVNLGYDLVYVSLPGEGPFGDTRGDHIQIATLALNYSAAPWLAIRPYADYQTRVSNVYGANFNASVFGVSVLIQWPKVSGNAPQPAMGLGAAF